MSGECRGGESGRGNEVGRVGFAQETTGRGACGVSDMWLRCHPPTTQNLRGLLCSL